LGEKTESRVNWKKKGDCGGGQTKEGRKENEEKQYAMDGSTLAPRTIKQGEGGDKAENVSTGGKPTYRGKAISKKKKRGGGGADV